MKRSSQLKRTQLQRGTSVLKRGRRLKAGKNTLEWNYVRQWLKIQFKAKGIVTCQLKFAGCWFDNALSFCHAAKRRKLTPRELYVVCLACTPCHSQIEIMPPERMRSIVEAAWASTGITLPQNS